MSLALLFMIKLRLRLRLLRYAPAGLKELDPSAGWKTVPKTDPAERRTTNGKSDGYSVQIENLGLGSAVELEARLWLIKTNPDQLDDRTKIDLEVDKLLELSGKWREARRTPDDVSLRVGNSYFRFKLPAEVGPEQLVNGGRYLFQVWSKHGFTNFGRVHKLRIARGSDGEFKYADDARDAARQSVFAYLIRLITRLFASKATPENKA